MITFSCRKNESIIIGAGIIVTVLDIQGPRVRLGIQHPDGTSVQRTEILEAAVQAAESWQQE